MKRKNYSFNRLIVGSFFVLSSSFLNAQTPDVNGIVYVKPISSGDGSGDSWLNATDNLQGAIDASGTTNVFVAVGTYPATSASFIMKNNVAIYGGFDPENGVDDLSDNRILPTELVPGSVLDGLNARPLIWNDNNGLDNSAILDGFTLTNGYSNNNGGAIFNVSVAPYFNNLVISNSSAYNGGGAVYNSSAPIALSHSIIVGNSAAYGGGIMNYNADVVIENIQLNDNTASLTTSGAGGGGIFNQSSNMTLTNALIINNTTGFQGAAFVNLSGDPVLTNVTIANNTADVDFSGLDIRGGNPTINNSIVYGSTNGTYTANHSIVEGNADFTNGNIDASTATMNSVFSDAANDDYTLPMTSPAVDAGDNTLYSGLSASSLDLAGNPRLSEGIIDLGAYEYQSTVGIKEIVGTELVVYPNPVKTMLNVKTDKEINIQVLTIQGTIVFNQSLPAGTSHLNVQQLASGIYLIQTENGGSTRFIKE